MQFIQILCDNIGVDLIINEFHCSEKVKRKFTLSSGRPFHQPRESPSLLNTKILDPVRSGSWPLSDGRKS